MLISFKFVTTPENKLRIVQITVQAYIFTGTITLSLQSKVVVVQQLKKMTATQLYRTKRTCSLRMLQYLDTGNITFAHKQSKM